MYIYNIFEHCFLYTAYGDDMMFFWKMYNPLKIQLKYLTLFHFLGGLKPKKCEIAGTGALKGVQVAVGGMRCNDFSN